jgi:hypothetical protein
MKTPLSFKRTLESAVVFLALAGLTSCTTPSTTNRTVELFNGRNLDGWAYVLADSGKMDQVWSVEDGILVCRGTPVGALFKGPDVVNFRLVVEYRWAPGTKPGNSGIFSRINGPMKPIPPAIETQLMHGNAGDVLGLQGKKVASGQPRFFEVKAHALAGDITGVKKTKDAEKPDGEWNRVEILAQGPRYQVWMNGELINDVQGVEVVSGPVGVQSEGGVIHFRRISLTPMD